MRKPRKSAPPKKRNLAARQAVNQKSVTLKDRRQPRGGSRNTMREDLKEID